jgi:2',3'-cyclic-nucleotide 2'-phosphodiesterase (5'-nucleotidase family)
MDITSSDIELGQESAVGSEFGETFQLSGLRFRNIDVPAGAIIESASIQFTVDNFDKNLDPTELYIVVEDAASANAYVDVEANISSRTYVQDTVDWIIPAGTWATIGESGPDQATPDISSLLQAAVNRPDWEPGNAVAFVIGGSGIREAESFDGSAEDAAILKYTFAKGDPEPVVPEILAEIEDIETTVNTSFSVDLNDFFIDEDSKLFFSATLVSGEDLPETISLDFEEGVIRGYLPEPSNVEIKVVAESLGDTISQTFAVNALPRMIPDIFTLELLHVTDQEAGAPAIQDAPRLSAVMNALEAEDLGNDGIEDNTLRLSSGDAFIPGLFYDASGDAFGARGVADIQIQNELGFKAIAFGNHEFDFGTEVLAGLISGETAAPAVFDLEGTDLAGGVPFTGANFPYLSSNLNFSFTEFMGGLEVAGSQLPQAGKVTSSAIVQVNGESIGVVGATTPILESISSPDDVDVLPAAFGNEPTEAEIDALAEIIQEEVDLLLALNPTINKMILLAHMQRIDIEFALAEKLEHVDIIVAGGSNTRLLDADDRLRDGDTKQGEYPSFFTNAGGTSTAVVNTDGSYKYVGRLVIDFDAAGNIIPESYDVAVSGAYATDEQGVSDLSAASLVDPEVAAIAAAIQEAIVAKESNVFGVASTYLNGNRAGSGTADDPDGVRTQETNLGNLTADANLVAAKAVEPDVLVSIKNGGGIRASIGQIIVPVGGTEPVRLPNEEILDNDGNVVKPAGGISENDINTTLAFNNGLSLLTLTKTELRAVLEHGVALLPAVGGQFIQVGGVNFSFDPSLDPGARIRNAVFVDENGETTETFMSDGAIVGDASETVRIVTLNFLAGGGDDYPFPDGAAANRVDLYDLDGDGVNDGATGGATFADDGTEQDALAEYLLANFTVDMPFDAVDVGPALDNRIQNLAFRADGIGTAGASTASRIQSLDVATENITSTNLNVYPNPLQTTLNVQLPKDMMGEIEVIIQEAATGREISRDRMKMNNYGALKMDVSEIRTRGVYIMTLKLEDGKVINKRLVK